MSLPTCVNDPKEDRILVLRQWHIDICDGDKCAAALLSFFIYFHNVKVEISRKNKQANEVANLHGDEGLQDESFLQFHTMDELRERILGLYKETTIRRGIALLEGKNIVSLHRNPNPRYNFDKTNHYLLHPEVCNEWLAENKFGADKSSGFADKSFENNELQKENHRLSKNEDRYLKNKESIYQKTEIDQSEITDRYVKNTGPSRKSEVAIPKNTYQEKDKYINTRERVDNNFSDVVEDQEQVTDQAEVRSSEEVVKIIDYLIAQGVKPDYLNKPDAVEAVRIALVESGVRIDHYREALQRAYAAKPDGNFGLYYLLKIIANEQRKESAQEQSKQYRSNNNYHKTMPSSRPTIPDCTGCADETAREKAAYLAAMSPEERLESERLKLAAQAQVMEILAKSKVKHEQMRRDQC